MDGALTRLADRTLLVCQSGQWVTDADIYPSSDRWVSYGPELVLYGQGRRNPEFMAGDWTGTPQSDQTRCGAGQLKVIAPGELGALESAVADPGQPLEINVPTRLFSITLTGFCLWQRMSVAEGN